MTRIALLTACVLAVLTGCGGGDATELVSEARLNAGAAVPSPDGSPALVLSGAIGKPNDGSLLALDVDTLERMTVVRYRVLDPWEKREVVYSGVLLSELLDYAGASADAEELELTALDDYQVTIAVSDLERWPVLLATRADGKRLAVDQGGPTKVVFPYHAYDIDHGAYDSKWIWSVETAVLR